MARLQTIEFPPTRKLVGYERFVKWNVYTPEIPKVEITNELTVDGWIPFTFAMLNYDPFHMAKLIVKHSPQSIPQLLRTLANLEEMLKKYTTTCTLGEHINSSCVKQCRVSLLLELTEATDYKSTDEDKRDLQSYFLSKMDATKTKTQLENVINENKDCYALKHHKRTTADSSYELLCLLKLTNSSFKVSNYYFNGEPYYFRVGFYSSSRIIDDNFDYILSFIIDTNKIRNELTQVKLFVELISDSRNVDVLVRALQILFEKNEAQHMPVIAYIMERCSNIDYSLESHLIDHTMIRIHHPYVLASKLVGHTYGQDKTYNSYMPTDVIVQTWSPLTTAMLNYDPDQMANLIIKHQQFTPTIIANLNELEEKLVNAASPTLGSHVDAAFVRKCRLALLLRLNESSAYQVTFKDKRDLELYFMNKVNCAKNQVELDSVTKEGNACYLLQQHRNPVFDTVAGLFGKSKMTKAEETIANCVEAKRKTFRVMRTPL